MSGSSSPVRKVVVAGALGAVSIVLILTPFGMIPWFAGASLTTMHVPAIVGAVLEGPVVGLAVGGIFGVAALVRAATAPNGPIDVFFVNPLVSVLPRLLFPVIAWLVYRAFRGKLVPLASAVAGIAGSLSHSFLVLGALTLAGALPPATSAAVFVANGPIEAAVAAVLTAAVVSAWKGVEGRKGRSKLSDEGE
jgi:uncharacterized membrane protein